MLGETEERGDRGKRQIERKLKGQKTERSSRQGHGEGGVGDLVACCERARAQDRAQELRGS